MEKRIILLLVAGLLMVGFWIACQPPSDETAIAIYQQHQDHLNQLVQLYHADQVGMIVHKKGSIFPMEVVDQLPVERLDLYRLLMQASGVTRSLGGNPAKIVTFQIRMPSLIRPSKTLLYSPSPPPLITAGVTDDYRFTADQNRYICRLIDENWYICLDYED